MSAISVLQVKFNVEFTRQVVNFSWIAYIKPPGETKRFAFLWAKPVHKQWKPFQSLFRMKTTFISNSWRKKCLTFQNLDKKNESAKYGVIWDIALIETFFHLINILDLPATACQNVAQTINNCNAQAKGKSQALRY